MVINSKNNQLPLVVHIIDRLPPDGAERLMVDILKNRSSRFRFYVLCLVEGGALESELETIGVPVVIFNKYSKFDVSIIFKLVSWLRKNRPSVVHTHLFTADTWGRLAAFISRVPCIINTVHSTNTWKGPVHRIIDQLLSIASNKVVACSEEVANVLKNTFHISNKRITVISNGIDFLRFESLKLTTIKEIDSLPCDVLKIVVIGRLHPAKGHFDLIEAISKLKYLNTQFHVFLVGEGELHDEIVKKCKETSITNYVTLLGQRSDIPLILAKTDLFVMPSHWEGLPMALLEAMAMSMAVIATKVGGIPNVIDDGVNGLLIDKGDVVALEKRIQQLMCDSGLRQKLGEQAKKTVVEKFSAKNVASEYESLYQTIIGKTP